MVGSKKGSQSGPKATSAEEVLELFDFHKCWDGKHILVDYILGASPNGGVFVVAFSDDPYQRRMLSYYKMGDGPFYVFTRPYHLCHIEAVRCIAEAVIDGESLLKPDYGFVTNVFSYAKRDLRAGEILDGVGGYNCYGMIENCEEEADDGVPICQSNGQQMKIDIRKDERITRSML